MNMSKTPVSILQEMMVKKQTVPDYELIHDGGGTHINTFTYKVTCDGLSANGTGRSKKDAKHEAANAMLQAIAAHRGYPQLPASPAQSPLRTPLPPTVPESQRLPPNVPFVNAIGALQDICLENNLEEPDYVLISDVGPPHAKIFTMQCLVATFKEVGIARTKKQAKQDAAKKMLDKITDLVADLKDIDLCCSKSDNELPMTKKSNLGFKVSEYHTKFRNSFSTNECEDIIQKLESLIPQEYNNSNISEDFVEDFFSKVKEFLSTLDLNISAMHLECVNSESYIVALRLNTSPKIVQISVEKTIAEAKFYTILKLINSVVLLLK
ncbi:RISC-loading complex subunit TARBP2-like [Hylaeus volcanicus]|uniref:RISC-loading complex subunit TARBP2-like n=1 Tax=Hylaeus volcanicus TaxID=313075 RepID=UPI0023B7BB09|nr:RISC-loading complex subunit TARBP2-like [Hylaeus volcanicus]